MKPKSRSALTKAEEEIMQLIWVLQPCLVRDIIEHLGQPDIPHSTVSSVVRILEKKGFVAHKAYGKTHEYRALISKEEYAEQNVKSLIGKYFGGSPKQLISYLIQEHDIDLKELASMRQSLAKKGKE